MGRVLPFRGGGGGGAAPPFLMPYVKRSYYSPSAGREVEVLVKEMPLTEHPGDFVARRFLGVYGAGGALLTTDTRGTRPWRAEEFAGDAQPKEQPWTEVWHLPRAGFDTVLDVIKYTGFYGKETMDRFDEFAELAAGLEKTYGAFITSASSGGVGIQLASSPDEGQWGGLIDSVYAFAEKHFTASHSKKGLAISCKRNSRLFFGHI